jgi:hypothetical protein
MKAIALNSIEYIDPKTGNRAEVKPDHMFEVPKGQERALADVIREPTEAEVALYEKQNKADVAVTKTAPPVVMKEPATPNGPGGATGEDTSGNRGTSSVAADTDTTGTSEEGKTTETGPEADDKAAKAAAKKTAAPAKKKRGEDLT